MHCCGNNMLNLIAPNPHPPPPPLIDTMLNSALRFLMRDICNTDIFAPQADQSGTIAEILIEDGKPVSIDTVISLSLHPPIHTHIHIHTQTPINAHIPYCMLHLFI